MTEFDKWFEQAGIRFTRGGCCKETWKAALEWALLLNSVRVHDAAYDDIKKELDGK